MMTDAEIEAQLDQAQLSEFKAKLPFEFEAEGFIVKTASTLEDLKLALKLRHKVFLEEGLNKTHLTGLEFDDFDHRADHLTIIEKEKGMAVGTYRLIQSDHSDKFYSQGEFHLDEFLALEGRKLELGRACTHSDYRSGRSMDLLWQGLSKYIRDSKTRYLFGCSSIDSTDPSQVFSVIKSLQEKNQMSDDFNMSMRKFLKQVGVTSQQAIEDAMRKAGDTSGKVYDAKMVLKIDGLDMEHVVEGEIEGQV